MTTSNFNSFSLTRNLYQPKFLSFLKNKSSLSLKVRLPPLKAIAPQRDLLRKREEFAISLRKKNKEAKLSKRRVHLFLGNS